MGFPTPDRASPRFCVAQKYLPLLWCYWRGRGQRVLLSLLSLLSRLEGKLVAYLLSLIFSNSTSEQVWFFWSRGAGSAVRPMCLVSCLC